MVELSPLWRTVTDALIDAPRAWQSPAELARALARGVEETTDLLCDLDVAGWVEVWNADAAQGPVVTLTPAAASRLGVRLVEAGRELVPRWARENEPDPAPPRTPGHDAGLNLAHDPAPSPEQAAARAERSATAAAERIAGAHLEPGRHARSVRPEDLPAPSLLLGQNLTPWPGPAPEAAAHETCPACGNRRLEPHMYCLYCDRWGLDAEAPAAAEAHAPRRPEPDPARDRRDADRLRAGRRSRRRLRHPGGRPARPALASPNLRRDDPSPRPRGLHEPPTAFPARPR